jgi:hypothetical protein
LTTTKAGKLKEEPWSKSEAADLYAAHVGSHVLATVREGFAVVPSLDEITTVVLRYQGDRFGLNAWVQPIALYVGTFRRDVWSRVNWMTVDPGDALEQADDVHIRRTGRARILSPLPTSDEVAQFLDQFAAAQQDDGPPELEGDCRSETSTPAAWSAGSGDPSPAGWFPDPVERYQLRWWDGTVWTENVATGQECGTDPLFDAQDGAVGAR